MVLWHFTKSSQNRLDLFSLELPLTLSMAAGWGRRNRYKSRPLGSRFQQWRLWRPTRPLNIWFTNKNTLKCLKSFIPRFDDWKAFNIQDSGNFVHQPYLCPNMRLSSSAHWEISKYPSKRNADHCFISRKSSSQPRLSETPTAFCPQWWVDIRIGMSFHLLPHPYHWISQLNLRISLLEKHQPIPKKSSKILPFGALRFCLLFGRCFRRRFRTRKWRISTWL